MVTLIDTFSTFLAFWTNARHASMDEQVERWAFEYIAAYPELLGKQIDDYTSQNLDWRQIAKEKVFPFIDDRVPVMQTAHDNLVSLRHTVCERAQAILGFKTNHTWLIYVGIGCGAGWVTTYQDQPAILFGLENIAECGWSDLKSITGLTAHEYGHIIQQSCRKEAGKLDDEGPWWQLFTEGFAQRCEHVILGVDTWHEAERKDQKDWLDYCEHNLSHLASLFLDQASRSVLASDQLLDVRKFFGSWYDIDGYSQTGYYLGHQAIVELEKSGMSLRDIALLEKPESEMVYILKRWILQNDAKHIK
jgi:hypothetical protein